MELPYSYKTSGRRLDFFNKAHRKIYRTGTRRDFSLPTSDVVRATSNSS